MCPFDLTDEAVREWAAPAPSATQYFRLSVLASGPTGYEPNWLPPAAAEGSRWGGKESGPNPGRHPGSKGGMRVLRRVRARAARHRDCAGEPGMDRQ